MRISVFGNRSINDEDFIIQSLANILDARLDVDYCVYIHGGAAGPQEIATKFFGGDQIIFKPWHMIWNKLQFIPDLFYFRNKQIVQNSDLVIFFSNGEKDSEVDRVKQLVEQFNVKSETVEYTKQ